MENFNYNNTYTLPNFENLESVFKYENKETFNVDYLSSSSSNLSLSLNKLTVSSSSNKLSISLFDQKESENICATNHRDSFNFSEIKPLGNKYTPPNFENLKNVFNYVDKENVVNSGNKENLSYNCLSLSSSNLSLSLNKLTLSSSLNKLSLSPFCQRKNDDFCVTDRGYLFTFSKSKPLGEGNYKQFFETTVIDTQKNSIDAVYCKFGFEGSEKKGKMTPEEIEYEKNLWMKLTPLNQEKHTGLVEYFGSYEDKSLEKSDKRGKSTSSKVHFVFKKYPHGNLQENLISIKKSDPHAIKSVVGDILLGVKTLHDQKIAHLDLKPDNILLKKDSKENVIGAAITDLGLSRQLIEGQKVFGKAINAKYAPKEYLQYREENKNLKIEERKPFGNEIFGYDIYALGLIFMQILNPKSSKASSFCGLMLYGKNNERRTIDDCIKAFEELDEEAFTFPSYQTQNKSTNNSQSEDENSYDDSGEYCDI